MEPRIAEQDLQRSASRRIPFLDDRQVGLDGLEHAGILPEPGEV
jgi:hypothetical protein